MADASINASTHAHVVSINAGHHNTIVKFQEQLRGEREHRWQVERLLRDAVAMLANPDEYTREDRWNLINDVRRDGWAA